MTTEPGNKRADAKARTREHVLDSARSGLLTLRDPEALTMREVAMRANLTTGSIFSNFESKRALLLEAAKDPAVCQALREYYQARLDELPSILASGL